MSPPTFLYPSGGVLVSHMILVLFVLSKALAPIVVTLLPMVTEVRELHLLYLQPIITQYFIDNKSEIWLLFLIAHSKR